MIGNIRKALHEDLWNIIDDKEGEEKPNDVFLALLFYLFLEKQQFKMIDVVELSKQLKKKYYEVLEDSKKLLLIGNPIKAMKRIDEKFPELVNMIVERFYGTS